MKAKILELTNDNKEKYINQFEALKEKIIDNMGKNERTGQIFTISKDDILDYINSDKSTVMCATDEEDKVLSVACVTKGNMPFTYNDITKYFKYGPEYKNYIKQLYRKIYNYKLIDTYYKKIDAYKYARQKVLNEHKEYDDINEFLVHELRSKKHFDEKSELREKINRYMSEYMLESGCIKEYEHFYWTTSKDLLTDVFKNRRSAKTRNSIMLEYDKFMEKSQLEIYSKNITNLSDYYRANTANSIEINTNITDPNYSHSGLDSILIYEGIKKQILNHFKNSINTRVYLCSSLQKQSQSSKYVSDFFGLTDNLYVKRNVSEDREIHISKIEREEYYKYLQDMEEKLIVLYNFNPRKKAVSTEKKIQILKEQLDYETEQYRNLNKVRNETADYTGKLTNIMPNLYKIGKLKSQIKQLEQTNKEEER
ncbi:MAG: hypothetical protein IKF97_02210 [Clostridia bacterium]|nr:hypothetical protein [Clostridia bacterium]